MRLTLLDAQRSQHWLEQHFHPNGLTCPRCGARREEAYIFRRTQCSRLEVYRCPHQIQQQAHQQQTPLAEPLTQADEMFQNAGEKRRTTRRP